MEEAVNFNISPFQVILALAFQVWLIVFPILILKKLNHLTRLLEDRFSSGEEES
jgi:hypothetical protein